LSLLIFTKYVSTGPGTSVNKDNFQKYCICITNTSAFVMQINWIVQKINLLCSGFGLQSKYVRSFLGDRQNEKYRRMGPMSRPLTSSGHLPRTATGISHSADRLRSNCWPLSNLIFSKLKCDILSGLPVTCCLHPANSDSAAMSITTNRQPLLVRKNLVFMREYLSFTATAHCCPCVKINRCRNVSNTSVTL